MRPKLAKGEKIPESKIEKKVVRYCKGEGLLTYKFSSPARRGVPDRIIIGKSKVMFLELKSLGGKITPLQQREIELLWFHGCTAHVADTYEKAVEIIADYFADALYSNRENTNVSKIGYELV